MVVEHCFIIAFYILIGFSEPGVKKECENQLPKKQH